MEEHEAVQAAGVLVALGGEEAEVTAPLGACVGPLDRMETSGVGDGTGIGTGTETETGIEIETGIGSPDELVLRRAPRSVKVV